MLAYIHCDGTCVTEHITELPNHTVRISLRKGIIHCLEVFLDLTAYHHPVADTLLLPAGNFIQCLDQGTCFRQDLDLIFSIFVNIPLKIVRIKVYTDDLRAFCKFIHFGTDLSGTQGNAETQKQITFGIGDHVCISVAIGSSDTPKILGIIISQNRLGKHTGNNRDLTASCKTDQLLLTDSTVYPMSQHDHRPSGLFQLITDYTNCLICTMQNVCRSSFHCLFHLNTTDILFKLHVINRILHFSTLDIHRQINKHRASPPRSRNMIGLVQLCHNILRITDLYCIFCNRLCHSYNICLLEPLLAQTLDPGIFIGIQLSCKENHRKRIIISIRHTTEEIHGTRAAGSVSTGTFLLCLGITTGCKSSSLLIVAGMVLCIRISLYRIHQMGNHCSLIAKKMTDSFFL